MASYVAEDATVGVLVEVNCETDFVAKTDNFMAFRKAVAKHIAQAAPADVDALLAQSSWTTPPRPSPTWSATPPAIGEKISIRRFARYETQTGVVESYIHLGQDRRAAGGGHR